MRERETEREGKRRREGGNSILKKKWKR